MSSEAQREAQRIISSYEAFSKNQKVEKFSLTEHGQRMILQKSQMILDQISLSDSGWMEQQQTEAKKNSSTLFQTYHLIQQQLEEKQAEYNFFLHFLSAAQLLDQLTEEQKCLLASGAEKLAAIKALRDWENTSSLSWKEDAEAQLFHELVTGSMRDCVSQRSKRVQDLSPHQIFYSQVSRGEEILFYVQERYKALSEYLFEKYPLNEAQTYSLFLLTQTNLLFHSILKAAAEYHYKCHQNVYRPIKDTSSNDKQQQQQQQQQKSQSLPRYRWSSDSKIIEILKKQIFYTTEFKQKQIEENLLIVLISKEQLTEKLNAQIYSLSDLLFDSYAHLIFLYNLDWVKESELWQEYTSLRTQILQYLLDKDPPKSTSSSSVLIEESEESPKLSNSQLLAQDLAEKYHDYYILIEFTRRKKDFNLLLHYYITFTEFHQNRIHKLQSKRSNNNNNNNIPMNYDENIDPFSETLFRYYYELNMIENLLTVPKFDDISQLKYYSNQLKLFLKETNNTEYIWLHSIYCEDFQSSMVQSHKLGLMNEESSIPNETNQRYSKKTLLSLSTLSGLAIQPNSDPTIIKKNFQMTYVYQMWETFFQLSNQVNQRIEEEEKSSGVSRDNEKISVLDEKIRIETGTLELLIRDILELPINEYSLHFLLIGLDLINQCPLLYSLPQKTEWLGRIWFYALSITDWWVLAEGRKLNSINDEMLVNRINDSEIFKLATFGENSSLLNPDDYQKACDQYLLNPSQHTMPLAKEDVQPVLTTIYQQIKK